jgi:hypothetical protein
MINQNGFDITSLAEDVMRHPEIPSEMQKNGEKVCGALDMKAIGYHPNAQDENGKVFPGGGYLCVPNK